MNFNKVDASRIKFEARVNPPPEAPQGGSKFGRFLSSFGALAAPVGFASSFFFPPAAIVGAAAYGLGRYGGHRNAVRMQEGNSARMPMVAFPGFNTNVGVPGGAPQPVGARLSDPMNVISNRQAATNDMIGQMR